MKILMVVLLICGVFCVDLVTGLTKMQFFELEKAWRNVVCGENDDSFLEKLEACDNLIAKDIVNVFHACESTAYPKRSGSIEFVKAACADRSIFVRYDSCLNSRISESFLGRVLKQAAAINCYENVMGEYGLLTQNMKISL